MQTNSGFLTTLVHVLLIAACTAAPDRARTTTSALRADTGHVAISNGSLFFEQKGTGDVVILIHGGNLDRRMWDPQFDSVSKSHHVIRYDARGYGLSSPADQPFSAQDDLLALMRGLHIAKASFVGLSMGARIAIDFALAHPEMVDRIVLAAPGISGGTWAADGDTLWVLAARAAAKTGDSLAVARAWLGSAYIRTALHPPARADWIREIVDGNASYWMGIVRHHDLEREAIPAAADHLEQLQALILLLVGEQDTPFIQDVAKAIAARAPNVRRNNIPFVGHMLNLEATDRFNTEVQKFLAGRPVASER